MMNTGNAMRTTIDDLTERIEIARYAKKRDSAGNIVTLATQALFSTKCWAKVLPVSAAVGEGYEAVQNSIGYRITARFREDILPDDLIYWRDKTLTITAPPYDAESRRKWIILDARESVPDGGQT